MSKLLELVMQVVDNGVKVGLFKRDSDGLLVADLNFYAKSHGHLLEKDDTLVLEMRYDEYCLIETVSDLRQHFLRAYRMRKFGSESWLEWCEREGEITKTVNTSTSWE